MNYPIVMHKPQCMKHLFRKKFSIALAPLGVNVVPKVTIRHVLHNNVNGIIVILIVSIRFHKKFISRLRVFEPAMRFLISKVKYELDSSSHIKHKIGKTYSYFTKNLYYIFLALPPTMATRIWPLMFLPNLFTAQTRGGH